VASSSAMWAWFPRLVSTITIKGNIRQPLTSTPCLLLSEEASGFPNNGHRGD
jgi:hypothetical protein